MTLGPLDPQAHPAPYVNCMEYQALQDLQETLGSGEHQVSTQQQQTKLYSRYLAVIVDVPLNVS